MCEKCIRHRGRSQKPLSPQPPTIDLSMPVPATLPKALMRIYSWQWRGERADMLTNHAQTSLPLDLSHTVIADTYIAQLRNTVWCMQTRSINENWRERMTRQRAFLSLFIPLFVEEFHANHTLSIAKLPAFATPGCPPEASERDGKNLLLLLVLVHQSLVSSWWFIQHEATRAIPEIALDSRVLTLENSKDLSQLFLFSRTQNSAPLYATHRAVSYTLHSQFDSLVNVILATSFTAILLSVTFSVAVGPSSFLLLRSIAQCFRFY